MRGYATYLTAILALSTTASALDKAAQAVAIDLKGNNNEGLKDSLPVLADSIDSLKEQLDDMPKFIEVIQQYDELHEGTEKLDEIDAIELGQADLFEDLLKATQDRRELAAKTKKPTMAPTTAYPTTSTKFPTKKPTVNPTTGFPTAKPTSKPTTGFPTSKPTSKPTKFPTKAPTNFPTQKSESPSSWSVGYNKNLFAPDDYCTRTLYFDDITKQRTKESQQRYLDESKENKTPTTVVKNGITFNVYVVVSWKDDPRKVKFDDNHQVYIKIALPVDSARDKKMKQIAAVQVKGRMLRHE